MSTTSKTGGSCKKCNRKCQGQTQSNRGPRNSGNISTWTMGPIPWIPQIVGGELISDEPILDYDALYGEVGELVSFMKLGCLSGLGSVETESVKQKIYSELIEKLDKMSITPPPKGQCTYIGLSDIKVTIDTVNCVNKPAETKVEASFGAQVATKDCP